MENGAFVAYGRSAGALSVCMTMELGAVALRLGMAADPARSLGLIDHARRAFFGEWLDGGLITAHRHRATEAYRGVYRHVADDPRLSRARFASSRSNWQRCRAVAADGGGSARVRPFPRDRRMARLRGRASGRVMDVPQRADRLSVPLHRRLQRGLRAGSPRAGLVRKPGGQRADLRRYRASPEARPIIPLIGLPDLDGKNTRRLARGLRRFPAGLPPARCRTNDCPDGAWPNTGSRAIRLSVDEQLVFRVAAGRRDFRPARVGAVIETGNRFRPGRHARQHGRSRRSWQSGAVAGAKRRRVHQVNFPPATEIRFSYRMRPVLKVAVVPHSPRLPRRTLRGDATRRDRQTRPAGSHARIPDAAASGGRVRPRHRHHPRWLARASFQSRTECRRRSFCSDAWISSRRWAAFPCGSSGHSTTAARTRPSGANVIPNNVLYHAWAAVTDGVVHHSEWGMKLMRAELPFQPTARHIVLPHGHYAAQMPRARPSRGTLEARFSLEPTPIRFGVIGRAQPEKQVGADRARLPGGGPRGPAAFRHRRRSRAGRGNRQTTRGSGCCRAPAGCRARKSRRRLHVCDALVCAQTGDTYLTSGSNADAIGAGLAMLAPDWGYFRDTLGAAAFYHDNTEAGLARLFATLGADDLARGKAASAALQSASAWPNWRQKRSLFSAVCRAGEVGGEQTHAKTPRIQPTRPKKSLSS